MIKEARAVTLLFRVVVQVGGFGTGVVMIGVAGKVASRWAHLTGHAAVAGYAWLRRKAAIIVGTLFALYLIRSVRKATIDAETVLTIVLLALALVAVLARHQRRSFADILGDSLLPLTP